MEYKSTTAQFGELCAVVDLQSRRYDSVLQVSCTQITHYHQFQLESSLALLLNEVKSREQCSGTTTAYNTPHNRLFLLMRALLIVERPSVVMRGHCVVRVLSANVFFSFVVNGCPFFGFSGDDGQCD